MSTASAMACMSHLPAARARAAISRYPAIRSYAVTPVWALRSLLVAPRGGAADAAAPRPLRGAGTARDFVETA